MPKVKLKEFNPDRRTFDYIKEVDLASVPTSGDKVVANLKGTNYIFSVYDVHYADYNATGFPDII